MKIFVNEVEVWYGPDGEVRVERTPVTKPAQLFPVNKTDKFYGHYVYLPSDYDPAKSYPILFFWHGLGACGNGTTDLKKLLTVDAENPITLAAKGQFNHQMIVIAPQVPGPVWAPAITAFIVEMLKRYNTSHWSWTGLSQGAIHGMEYARRLTEDRPAPKFMFLIAGKLGMSPEEAARLNKRGVKVFVWCGANDSEYRNGSKLFAQLTGGTYTEIPNAGHDSRAWGSIYQDKFIYETILSYGKETV